MVQGHGAVGSTQADPAPCVWIFDSGEISSNFVEISEDLAELFSLYWERVLPFGRPGNLALPFFHLQGDGFWHLLPRQGSNSLGSQITSLGWLRRDRWSSSGRKPLRPCQIGGEPQPVAKRSDRDVLLTGNEAISSGAERNQPRCIRVQRRVTEPSRRLQDSRDAVYRGSVPPRRSRPGFSTGGCYRILPSLRPVWHPHPHHRRSYGCHGGAHRSVERDAG